MTSTSALYVTSGSMSLMSTFVALNMSTVWLIAFPNGDSCSYISSLLRYSSNCCFTGSAMFFDWILAISLTAISSILRSTGSMLPSTSIVSLPDVAGNPKHIDNPILVTSTDGVGTKIEIAKVMKKFNTIGIDLVAMCVNDLITCGAEPLLFLDYYVTDKLNVNIAFEVISGIVEGCKLSNCSLVGGETAEHPDSFPDQSFDLAGFALGVVDQEKIIGQDLAKKGDLLIGLASNGVHSNGFSLIRKIINRDPESLLSIIDGETVGSRLLTPTKIYVKEVNKLTNYNVDDDQQGCIVTQQIDQRFVES